MASCGTVKVARVAFAGSVNATVRPPDENWTAGSSGMPFAGTKRRFSLPEMAMGYGADDVTSTSGCCKAPSVSGTPVTESTGNDGSPTTSVWTRDALTPAASATSIVKLKVPDADAAPEMIPDVPLSAKPEGR